MTIVTQSSKNKKSVSHDDAMIAELRENPEYAEVYLQTALEDIYEEGGVGAFLTALRRVVEARGGIGEIAKKSGLSRQQLYRTLSENGNPTITTLTEITRAAGVRLIPHAHIS
ncbi:putative addiction module antidote protein [Erwiniaceae bacterium BAC15a-03b]|uniref:Addiction module antidote protein n=1 Tax=Winslowiella arboricola TaxID=2978220 RepID=A0A9J6PG67_9GAMM|nr:addiction module antidote protein [Winslowiella arboricola]MCU5773976.1 putative addiction module antidote protein [Winslowiella arboricola]MCU5777297.1 putative addiction module antidote protein [Winslowiella arboricola]